MEIQLAKINDIDDWMQLVNEVKDNFPGLETKEALSVHKETVLTFIKEKEAICAKINDFIVGILLFSRKNNELCFLAVSEKYRRQHIGEKMISYMLELIDNKNDISVTTYRKEDLKGKAARAFYKHIGFTEGKLTVEFGSPVQKFILKRHNKCKS